MPEVSHLVDMDTRNEVYSPPHRSLSCRRCWSDERNGSRPSASMWQSCWPQSSPGEERGEEHSIYNQVQIEGHPGQNDSAPVILMDTDGPSWLDRSSKSWHGLPGLKKKWAPSLTDCSLTYCPALPSSLSLLIIIPVGSPKKCRLYYAVRNSVCG